MNVDFDLHVAAATVVVEGADWVSGSHTNLFTNPSFESDADIPAGATRSTDWAASGSYSLYVPPAGIYPAAIYPASDLYPSADLYPA